MRNAKTLKLTWGDVENAVDTLASSIIKSNYIIDKKKTCLVPIIRGGLPIATMLSHKLDGMAVRAITYQTRDGMGRDIGRLFKYWREFPRLIIVEDIIDTGTTIDALNLHLKDIADGEKEQYVSLATLCANNHKKWSGFKEQWNAIDTEKGMWVVFPWER